MIEKAYDTETHLFKKGMLTPLLMCLSYAYYQNGALVTGLLGRIDGLKWFRDQLEDHEVVLIGHNIFFDLAVLVALDSSLLPLVYAKIQKNLIRDTQLRQQLMDLAIGQLKFIVDEITGEITKSSYRLSDLSWRLLKIFLKKVDTWRLKYALLPEDVSLWPEDARKYALDDAITTLEVYRKQSEIAGIPDEMADIPNSHEQHMAGWALYLMSIRGLRTDPVAVTKLKGELTIDLEEAMATLRTTDLIKQVKKKKGVADDVRDMKAIKARVERAFASRGEEAPRTDPSKSHPDGQISTARKTLVETGDTELKLLAEAGATEKLLGTYVPILESGTVVPITPRYNVLMETGRTSTSKPSIQNPPRKGGVRECFVARPNHLFAFSDYDTLESRALAQVNLDMQGVSSMAEALRRGEDLHLSLAAEMLGIPLEEAQRRFAAGDHEIKEYRQQAKPANFGFPGAMSAESFREYAEGYGIRLTSEQARDLRDTWFRKWPEMRGYFDIISELSDSEAPITQLRSGRMRGGASYCAIANGFFQGLAADLAKEACWRVSYECYVRENPYKSNSPLYGCRPVLFLHDEIGIEIPYIQFGPERSSAAANRLSEAMIEAAARWIPDVPVTCKPVLCRRWFKGADQVLIDGLLVPSRPRTIEENGKKRTVWEADL